LAGNGEQLAAGVEGGHGGRVDPRERWALEICYEHFVVFVLLYVEVRGYWDHRCAKVLTTPVMASLTRVVSGLGVRLKNPSVGSNRILETASAYACRVVNASRRWWDQCSYIWIVPTLAMTVRIFAVSATERPIVPTVSCVKDIGITPGHDISPLVGRKLNRLFALAWLRSELTVSVPFPITARLAAMAAPMPPELPPSV
jgi:hypothetical protein